MICRNCGSDGLAVFLDLGHQPLSNGFLTEAQLDEPEVHYPLKPRICPECCLIQLPPLPVTSFGPGYAFKSGQSASWLAHLENLVKRLNVTPGQIVADIGGNDGSLGKILPDTVGYLNVDPSADPSDPHVVAEYMGMGLANKIGWKCERVVALNVLAHVQDYDDFLGGIKELLSEDGVLVVEVPVNDDWTQIYHEHLAYFSEHTVVDVLERRGFFVDGIEQVDTHGGSLRLYCVHA